MALSHLLVNGKLKKRKKKKKTCQGRLKSLRLNRSYVVSKHVNSNPPPKKTDTPKDYCAMSMQYVEDRD